MISTVLAVSEPFISSATTVAEIAETAAAVSKAVMISTAAIVSIQVMIETVGAVSTHISPGGADAGLPIRTDLQRRLFHNFPKKSERELQIGGKLGGVQGLNTPLAPPSWGRQWIPQGGADAGLPIWTDLQRRLFRNLKKFFESELQRRGKLGGVPGLNTPLAPPSRGRQWIPQGGADAGLPIWTDLQRRLFRNLKKFFESELQRRGKLGGVQGLNTPLAPPSRGRQWIPQVINDGPFWGRKKLHFPCIIDGSRMKLRVKYSDRRAPITHATRSQSTSLICCAAATMSGAVETHLETSKCPAKAPLAIGLLDLPKLDDGGTGLPPRYDGRGGGGGGGGCGSSSGGFVLFAILLVLSSL